MAATKFELYKDRAGEYRWRLRYQNGDIIADSGEGYKTKAGAMNGIESVKENASRADIKELTTETPEVKQELSTEAPKAITYAPERGRESGSGIFVLAVATSAVVWFVITFGIVLIGAR